MLNKWLVQSFGNSVYFGIGGNQEFIEKSFAFSVNFGVLRPSYINRGFGSESFRYFQTTFEKLESGLKEEGRMKKRQELTRKILSEIPEDEIDDFLAEDREIDLTQHEEEIENFAELHYRNIFSRVRPERFIDKEFLSNKVSEFKYPALSPK